MCLHLKVHGGKSLARLFLAAESATLFLPQKWLLACFLLPAVVFLLEELLGLLLGSLSVFLDYFRLVSSLRDNQTLPTCNNGHRVRTDSGVSLDLPGR